MPEKALPTVLPTVAGQRQGRGQRPRGGIITVATSMSTTTAAFITQSYDLIQGGNNTDGNTTTPLDDNSASAHYDYWASFAQWVIICSAILGLALGFATVLYIRKLLNWDYRMKIRRLIKQRKQELIESGKVRRVRAKWQSPEEFLAAAKQRQEQQEFQAQRQRPNPNDPAGMSNKLLWYEYENLRRRKLAGTFHYTSLKAFVLSEKNFIKDCLPFDHNRVKLPLDPSVPCSDYINGSFVDGYSIPNFYLAIQGPFEASIVDFWRVVWIHKVRCIVMLCEPFEFAARQCFRYWPDKSMSYDDIDVKLESIHRNLDFTCRKFSVSHVASRNVLEVMHVQYKNWPQFGQPDVYTFLQFVYLIRSLNPDNKAVLVHSKTGSDRTGLYIAIDYCIESICKDNIVNIHESVRRIRRCRAGLVSAVEQYEFIYAAIRAFLLTGITEIPVKYLGKFVHMLEQPMNNLPTTGFDQHYEILAILKRNLTQNDSATGIMSENRWVSRDATCLPPDEYRPHLITGRKGCHDYINAVICHSYLKHNAYIVTQWPILTTMKDFWRMVYDYGIVSTVVLSDVSTGLRFPKFWPVKRGKRRLFDVVSVNLESKEKRIWGTEYSYTMRQWEGFVDMKAVLMKAGESAAAVPKGEGRTLPKWISKLFLVNGWKPNTPSATRSESIIEVLLEVEKWQKEAGPEKFICVVSTDGAQQCGVFMTLHMAHQQMLHDFKVDIMSTALAIRKTRPLLLPTKEEYEYCWRLAADLHKMTQIEAAEQSFSQSALPEVHQKPIPYLCSRCWYCQNKSKLILSNKLKLLSAQHQELSQQKEPEQHQAETPLQDDVFGVHQTPRQVAEEEKQPFISTSLSNDNDKTTMLTIIPPTINFSSRNSNLNDAIISIETPVTSQDSAPRRNKASRQGSSSQLLLQKVPSVSSNIIPPLSPTTTSPRQKAPMLSKSYRQAAFSQQTDDENNGL